MLRFVAWRVLGMIPVLAVALVASFLATRALPGDPVMVMLSDHSSDEVMAARLRAEYGLDRPVLEQFFAYVTGALSGDFGLSYRVVHTPVIDVLRDGLAISPVLAFSALALAFPIGAAAGAFAAVRRNTLADSLVILVLVAGLSIPNFAIATFLVYIFSIKLGWLPVAGWGDAKKAILPIVILAIPTAAYIARLSRTFMLEVLQQDFVRTARAKGLTQIAALWRHAVRNALIPVLTIIGLQFSFLIAGAIIIENVFFLPGLGRLIFQAINQRDLIVVESVVMILVFSVIVVTFLVDLAYAIVDPRLRGR
jgi:ABC-type dipeptide/oligopeptide/nickel transport system permease component